MSENKKLELQVAETLHSDIGYGIVRLDKNSRESLDLSEGDYVVIKGKNEAVAKVLNSAPEDESLNLIRMDSSLRGNAGISLGDSVEVAKTKLVEAKSITIAPTEEVKFSGDPTPIFMQKLLSKAVVKGNVLTFNIMGTTLHYVVTKTSPKKHVRVTQNTNIEVSDTVTKPGEHKVPSITYDEIGGLGEEVSAIREMVEIPMKHPEVFERIGISPPKGVLLHGPPGTGKTLLAKALANELDAYFKVINGPEIVSKYYGDSEKQLREIFEEAQSNAPGIIFIDEIDSIAPNRNEVSGESERRIVSQILTLMDGLKNRGNVVVIAATNRPNSIDPALRRPGRFDREIPINPPSREGRREILDVHTRGMPLITREDVSDVNGDNGTGGKGVFSGSRDKESEDNVAGGTSVLYHQNDVVDLDRLADITHGFTGADLEVLTKEAAMKALKKWIPDLVRFEDKIPAESLEHIKVSMKHFNDALHKVEPSAMREVLIKKPNVHWEDIGGLDKAKQELREMVEMPLREPEVFREAGISAPKGILLTGPPGTGKTMLAKAVATETEANFISVKGPELVSKWVGESEKAVREIFKKAKQVAPCVIFFDEFDSIASSRGGSMNDVGDKIVNQLLTELDGVEELTGVSVIAATNRADLIDEALKRPGRLDSIVEVDLPDQKTREAIFNIHIKNMPCGDLSIEKLSELSEGLNGAQIAGICQQVGLRAIRERKSKEDKLRMTQKMFEEEIKKIDLTSKKKA